MLARRLARYAWVDNASIWASRRRPRWLRPGSGESSLGSRSGFRTSPTLLRPARSQRSMLGNHACTASTDEAVQGEPNQSSTGKT